MGTWLKTKVIWFRGTQRISELDIDEPFPSRDCARANFPRVKRLERGRPCF
jgi:hypothetical protein